MPPITTSNHLKIIPALLMQEGIVYEIIIVNDRSSDGTENYLNHLSETYSNITIIKIQTVTKGISPKKNALTKGINQAKFPVILLTDADCLPLSNLWAKEMTINILKDNIEVCLGYSRYKKYPGF